VVPTEDGVDEQPCDGAEQLTVEGQAATKLMRHREDPLPQWYRRKHVLSKHRLVVRCADRYVRRFLILGE
jgi:hypothetical protein